MGGIFIFIPHLQALHIRKLKLRKRKGEKIPEPVHLFYREIPSENATKYYVYPSGKKKKRLTNKQKKQKQIHSSASKSSNHNS